MAKYISIIANGGKNIDVSIVKNIQSADGSEISREEIDEFVKDKLGISEDNNEELNFNIDFLNAVKEGMRTVTSGESGTMI